MTILNYEQIIQRLYEKDIKKRLVITPLIDEVQIGSGTVDLRLGNTFILFKSRKIHTIEPPKETEDKIREYQEKIVYRYGAKFILQPGSFILGSTLEYLKMPSDLLGYIVGRSSWGRLGLIIETSPIVEPCFLGVLTFELSNLGTIPIAIYPGSRIAQISFHKSDSRKLEDCMKKFLSSKYSLATAPEFSKIHEDKDLKKIQEIFSQDPSKSIV